MLNAPLGGLVAELVHGDQDALAAIDLAEDEHHRRPVGHLRHDAVNGVGGGGEMGEGREGCVPFYCFALNSHVTIELDQG